MESFILSEELFLMAKDAGFNERYNNTSERPIYDHVFNWLEEKHGLSIDVCKHILNSKKSYKIQLTKFVILDEKPTIACLFEIIATPETKKEFIDVVLSAAFDLIKLEN